MILSRLLRFLAFVKASLLACTIKITSLIKFVASDVSIFRLVMKSVRTKV